MSQKVTRIRKSQVRRSKVYDNCKESISLVAANEKRKDSEGEMNMEKIIKKIKPFGRSRFVCTRVKEEDVINIHTSSKKNLTIRPNTPRNWSFRNEGHMGRRPVSNYARNKIN
jgi:hypothetical protein